MEQHSTDQIWVRLDVHQTSITAAVLHGDSHDPEVVRMKSDLNTVRRLQRSLDAEIERFSQNPQWRASTEALRCFRGIKTLTADTAHGDRGHTPLPHAIRTDGLHRTRPVRALQR